MTSIFSDVQRFTRMSFCLATGLLLVSCGDSLSPEIANTTVEPSTVALSELESDVQFTLTTQVLHFGDAVTSVVATVEDEDISYDLVKSDDIVGGEEWTITTTLSLWAGFSEGTYYIDVTAVSSSGETVTQAKAASVTITS